METILLAQQCEVPEVLKSAYYELLRTPTFGQDLAAYVHAESSQRPSMLDVTTEAEEQNAPPPRLAASDFVRLQTAKEALQTEWLALVRAAPLPSAFPCPLAPFATDNSADADKRKAALECAQTRRDDVTMWTARLVQNGLFEVGFTDVMKGIDRLVETDWAEMGYCMGCVGERREAWTEKREKLWTRLDVLLGLRSGDED